MDPNQIKQNIKLGAFVLAGLVLFFTAILFMGKQNTVFSRTFTVSAVFKNVEGLKEGDAVWLSGVRIGMVKGVHIIEEGKVIVDLSLRERQNEFIKEDATATIGSDGLVGNKIVVIRPGTAQHIINDEDTINSFSPTDTQELFNLAKDVGVNTKSITEDLKLITAKLNKGEGIVGELIHEGELSTELRQLINSLKMASQNTNRATADLKNMIHDINQGDGLLAKLIHDSTYVTTFDNTLANVKEVGENSKVISNNLKDMIRKMDGDNNAIGVLLADTAFASKLKETLINAESASAKLDENMEALQHNFLLRGYFRRQAKEKEKEAN
ncbi:MAG TPA: MlaD family protein [Cyclobacteriaceae bacterium]|nr:MlaD family protein [Cyclobacteriaceae bacterium]